MWICSEMLVLTWMYFSSHRPLHLLLTLYNQNLSFGQKITDSADHTQEKWDHKHHPNHQPCFLPNCLMTKACERSALYHDRRTQGHATQKPCCKVVAIAHSSSIQQLLCSRFGAMWDGNLREAIKLRTCNSKWDQKFDFHAGVRFKSSIRKLGAWCLRQRCFGRLGVLTMGGETLHATDSAHGPTQMDPRRMCARYIKRNAQNR